MSIVLDPPGLEKGKDIEVDPASGATDPIRLPFCQQLHLVPCGREDVFIVKLHWPAGTIIGHTRLGVLAAEFGTLVVAEELNVTVPSEFEVYPELVESH